MLKKVEVACPTRVTLFLNMLEKKSKQINDYKLINQSIDLYNNITLQDLKKEGSGIIVRSFNKNVSLNQELFLRTCKLFFEYTGVNPTSFLVEIEKNIKGVNTLGSDDSIVAGILLGLDKYYKTNLTKKELMFLASNLGLEVPYFLHSGYSSVTNYGQNITKMDNKNNYQHYLIIQPNFDVNFLDKIDKLPLKPVSTICNHALQIYNDFNNVLPEELKRLREFLNKYVTNHSLTGFDSSYFVAYPENFSSKIILALKKEFPNYKLYHAKNAEGHKILTKYIVSKD